MKNKTFILLIIGMIAVGVLAWKLWSPRNEEVLRGESASPVTRLGTIDSSSTQTSPLPAPKPAPTPAPLPDILPEEGIPCPWKIYPETDRPELAVQESLRVVLKYVLGLELPDSAREFGMDKGFRMEPEDTAYLVARIKSINDEIITDKQRPSKFIDFISLFNC